MNDMTMSEICEIALYSLEQNENTETKKFLSDIDEGIYKIINALKPYCSKEELEKFDKELFDTIETFWDTTRENRKEQNRRKFFNQLLKNEEIE